MANYLRYHPEVDVLKLVNRLVNDARVAAARDEVDEVDVLAMRV